MLEKDYGADGVLTPTEIADVVEIDVGNKSISDLTGIKYFTALRRLYCNDNQLKALDVSACTNLNKLACNNNQLTTLNLSKNTVLLQLYCFGNKINGSGATALVNSLPTIPQQEGATIYFYDNEASTGNSMTYAQVEVAKGKGWSVKAGTGNRWVDYLGSDVITINETNFPDENFRNWLLEKDYGADGVLTPTEIADVTSIDVYGESITSLEGIEYFTALTKLDCSYNQLTALDVSKNTALKKLSCWGNQLTELNVSNNTALTELHCFNNQLTELDVSNNTALTELSCANNQLTALDVSCCTALEELYCGEQQLTALDVSKNTALTELSCWGNQLTELDVTKNTELKWLSCGNNQLTELDLSKNTTLKDLFCYGNQMKTLDVTNNTELTLLDCSNNLIRGEGMTVLVSSLPRRSTATSYVLRVYDNETPAGNMMTPAQVKVATDKGWNVLYYDGDDWVAYEGEEPGIAIDEPNFPDENFRAYSALKRLTRTRTDTSATRKLPA